MQSVTPDSGPITIFNFTQYLWQIFTEVNAFQANWKVVTDNQNASQQNEIQIIRVLRDQTAAIAGLGAQVAALNTNVSNLIGLVEATIQALGDVATLTVQQQELALLTQIAQFVNPSGPATIGLDLSSSTAEPQAAPSKSGP